VTLWLITRDAGTDKLATRFDMTDSAVVEKDKAVVSELSLREFKLKIPITMRCQLF